MECYTTFNSLVIETHDSKVFTLKNGWDGEFYIMYFIQ